MRFAWWVVAGSFVAGVLAGCGSMAMSGSTASTSALSAERGVHFVAATLASDSSVPANPGGPHMKVSGAVVSGSGVAVEAGTVEAYVLDGPPARAKYVVATSKVLASTIKD